MKITPRLTFAAAILAGCSFARADIVNNPANSFWSLNPSLLNCTSWSWAPDKGGGTLSMTAHQYGAGSTSGSLEASDMVDPTLTRGNDVVNDTGFAWSGYSVVVTMNQPFTISGVNVDVPTGGGWSDTITPAALSGSLYVGHINFVLPQINPGDELNFTYKVSFEGSLHYTITEDYAPVPEPGTLSLALLGGLAFGGVRLAQRSSRQQKS